MASRWVRSIEHRTKKNSMIFKENFTTMCGYPSAASHTRVASRDVCLLPLPPGRMKTMAMIDFLRSAAGYRKTMTENTGNAAIGERQIWRYEDSLIFERKPFSLPGGKTLAVWIIPNVEAWAYDSPGRAWLRSPNIRHVVPDVINYAWREIWN